MVQAWLDRALSDLRSAEILLGAEPPLVEEACFHCQQAVEKSLKSFLIYHDVEFEKLHAIEYLLDLCNGKDPSFQELRPFARRFTGYAVRSRYPHPGPRPSAEQSREELETARRVWRFVIDRLPKEVHPSNGQA